jgi:hypothetical protein
MKAAEKRSPQKGDEARKKEKRIEKKRNTLSVYDT